MRKIAMASARERCEFWDSIDETGKNPGIRAPYRSRLLSSMPPGSRILWFAPRRAGAGSLGRPRYVAVAHWRGGRIVREAKALVASAWVNRDPKIPPQSACAQLGQYRFRSPDPFFSVADGIAVRRLAPDSRKLDFKAKRSDRLKALRAMGSELANVHAAGARAARAITRDLAQRKGSWLRGAVKSAIKSVYADLEEWMSHVA